MKYKIILLFCGMVIFSKMDLQAQKPKYTFNSRVDIKQGASLDKLKNPFTGGFETPQFSAIDLNLDGTNDLLIFDRSTKKFYTFINDRIQNTISYTYAPQYEAKIPSPCSDFCLSYDYNNDGKMDLFVLMYGNLIFQYRNTSTTSLSFAIPDTLFDYNGINIYCPGPNIPSFNDIDNDGDMDIVTFDFGSTVTLYKNWRTEKGMPNNAWKYKYTDECWGKFYLTNSVTLGYHCAGFVLNNGDDYTPPPTLTGAEHQGSTLLTLDVDSDGDYEALVGDIYYEYMFFLKNGKKEFNYSRDTMIAFDSLYPSPSQRMAVTRFPSAYFMDVDNDGKRDIIMAPNDASGASKNKNQIFLYKNIGTDRKPIFNLIQNNFLQETTLDFGGNTAPAFVDIDGDGDDDLFIATQGEATQTFNSHDALVFYKNTGTLLNPSFELQDTNFLGLFSKNYSGLKPCFGDLNGDGKKDLLLGEATGKLKYFINTSIGNTVSFIENTTQFTAFISRNYAAPFLVDYNRDGKLDLFLGNYDGTITYYQNTGTKLAPTFTKTVDSVGKICLRAVDENRYFYGDGMSVPIVADMDNDGKFDLIVGGKYGIYSFYDIEGRLDDSLNLNDTVLRFSLAQLPIKKASGLYIAPAIAQLDSDAVNFDVMIGNNGGGISLFSTYEFKSKVGIHALSHRSNRLSITPNPASSTISIEGFENEIYSLQVFDATGKECINLVEYKNTKPILHIQGLQQGVYFVTLIINDGETFNGKFVKL